MASATRPVKYPRQLVIMLDDETADRIEADAVARGVGKSVITRELIADGFELTELRAEERRGNERDIDARGRLS